MRGQQALANARVDLAAAESGLEPERKAAESLRAEVEHLQRLKEQSDAMVATLHARIETLGKRLNDEAKAEADAALQAEVELAPVGDEPLDPLALTKRALEAEKSRREGAERNLATMRADADAALERTRRGAERSMRELQGEVARLQGRVAELSQALSNANKRSEAEAAYRLRAEEGWEKCQGTAHEADEQLQVQRARAAELEGQLSAARHEAAAVRSLRDEVRGARDAQAAAEGRLRDESLRAAAAVRQAEMEGLAQAQQAQLKAERMLDDAAASQADAVHSLEAELESCNRALEHVRMTSRQRVDKVKARNANAATQVRHHEGHW